MILSTHAVNAGRKAGPVHTQNRCISATHVSDAKWKDRGPRQNPHSITRRRGRKNPSKTVAYYPVYTVHTYNNELKERVGMRAQQTKNTRSVSEPCPSVDTPDLARLTQALGHPVRSFTYRDGMARAVLQDGRIVVGIGGTKAEAWGNLQSVISIKGEVA